jgi:ParB family transcriptional regulator, chromosome partitioning protein
MARSSGLGKGLSSIIPSAELATTDTSRGAVLADVPVAAISPNPNQPRVHFDEESLSELSASITEMGVLQPILVRPSGDGAYELIAGERRWRAAQRAGLTSIPAVVRMTDDAGSVEQALVENLHRQDLTALEEAAAYQQLLDEFSLTHDQIAGRVGKSRSAITNSLRLLGLPPAVQHLLADGQLSQPATRERCWGPPTGRARSSSHGRPPQVDGRCAWSKRRYEAMPGWPTASAERGAGPVRSGTDHGRRRTHADHRLRPPGLLELEHLLAEHLETRVSVQMSAKKGRVTIEFADLEDLERIYRSMTGA